MKTSIYFQKRAIVLVGAMLLTVTNLNVYSSVGSYQTHSQAIDANANYKKGIYLIREFANIPATWANIVQNVTDLPSVLAMPIEYLVDNYNYGPLNEKFSNSNTCLKEKKYAKYDFSGFDN